MTVPPRDEFPERLVEAQAELRRALTQMSEPDRGIALNAVRDALDRDAESLRADTAFVAGTFAVESVLARGPRFEIIRLRHRDAGTSHALKRPVAERRTDPLLRNLIACEARHQAAVVHPACLPARALLRLEDGRPGLLTDWVEAPTLAGILSRQKLRPADLIALAERLAAALGAVHGAGLVHGDLTPANLFIPAGGVGEAVLFDFGLSRALGSAPGDELHRAGTPAFAAPETLTPGWRAEVSADLYSLGRTILAAADRELRGGLGDLVEALTAIEPCDRPDLKETLERLQECGLAATDDRKNVSDPERSQLGAL